MGHPPLVESHFGFGFGSFYHKIIPIATDDEDHQDATDAVSSARPEGKNCRYNKILFVYYIPDRQFL
jgi:hypothetical protein